MPILRARPSRVQYREPSDDDRRELAESNTTWDDDGPPFVLMDLVIGGKRRRVRLDPRDEARDPYEDPEPFEWVGV